MGFATNVRCKRYLGRSDRLSAITIFPVEKVNLNLSQYGVIVGEMEKIVACQGGDCGLLIALIKKRQEKICFDSMPSLRSIYE